VLRYYVVATILVVGALAIGASLYRPGKPLEVASVQSTGSPSPPRFQAPSSRTPEPVSGEAPWALSALPECFAQTQEVRGSARFVRAHVPPRARPIPPGRFLRSGDCLVFVTPRGLAVARGEERLGVAGGLLFALGGVAFETPARRELLLLRPAGRAWELRRYRTTGEATVQRDGAAPSIRAGGN
jgi:hypothetical protein